MACHIPTGLLLCNVQLFRGYANNPTKELQPDNHKRVLERSSTRMFFYVKSLFYEIVPPKYWRSFSRRIARAMR
jgi:hypothetical protein